MATKMPSENKSEKGIAEHRGFSTGVLQPIQILEDMIEEEYIKIVAIQIMFS